jgi:GTP cyclohydrolase FolE2
MTEAQRRYLFRILAGRGLETDAAHEYLKKTFGVPTLKEVMKQDASAVIDELLKHPEEAQVDGVPQR